MAVIDPKASWYYQALEKASSGGYDEAVYLLLDKMVLIDPGAWWYHKALEKALSRGYDKVVQLLLDKVADTDFPDWYFQNPDYRLALEDASSKQASSEGHKKVVEMLLAKEARVKALREHADTPQAASSGTP